jgi:hypothetical protein
MDNKETALQLLKNSTATSLPASINQAFASGTNVHKLQRACPEELNYELVKLIKGLTDSLDVRAGIQTPEDLADAVAVIHDFPAMTVEEIRLAFAWIRQGKLGGKMFERFKARELRACLCEYEALRADRFLEHRHKVEDNYPRTGEGGSSDVIKRLIASLDDGRPKPYTDRWLSGKERKMSRQERERLQERDRQRRSQ